MDIKTLMRTRFVPPSYRKELLLSEYFKELKSQMRRVEIKETNKEKIKRFLNGLRRDIQDQVELYVLVSRSGMFERADKIKRGVNWFLNNKINTLKFFQNLSIRSINNFFITQ